MSNLFPTAIIPIISAAAVLAQPMAAIARPSLPGWRLVWQDEFSGSSLNSAKWNTENVAWPYNNELEAYVPQMVTEQSGFLTIKSDKQNALGRAYVSGRINTAGKFAQQFGRFEASMILPRTKGLWPAFWLLPPDVWPPEIDIMEQIGSQPATVLMTQHWGTVANHGSYGGNYTLPSSDFSQGLHTFAVEWSPTRIDWFVDGVNRFFTTSNVPQIPMNVLFNVAVGGDLPGSPDGTTVFPQYMYVDYVRAYLKDLPLLNPGFEDPATGTPVTSWQLFGNAGGSTVTATGARSVRLFGIAQSGPYFSGAFQDLPASPGENWVASVYGKHLSSSPLVGTNVELKIEWYDVNGTQLSFLSQPALTPTSPTDVFVPATIQGVAPAGTATARIAIVLVQLGTGSGTAYFDDAAFRYTTPAAICTADFNGNGSVTVQDIFDFLTAWFANNLSADVNASGSITVQDIFDFLSAWFSGC